MVSSPPHSISVTFLHPKCQYLVCMDIGISLNGVLTATLHANSTEKPPCSNSYATKILQTCSSIPLTIMYILRQA